MIQMPKAGEYVKFKIYEEKIKSELMIYADFKSILVPENNEKQNPDESYKSKYKKHIACISGYKLVCVEFKFELLFEVIFSKFSKSYLGKDVDYSFINKMIGESKCCTHIMEKHFNKELVMTKKYNT